MAKEASFCHVFLSFKGETRNKFTCFLHEALTAQGFVAFMDKTDICVGDEVDLTIKEGIKNSMSAIIIFSQNYAYSTWCLDELVLILERKKNSKYFIIPIFYEVEIRDIKHQLGNYSHALEQHRKRYHNDKVEKWRKALVEVGDILGYHVEGPHNAFIRNTVKLFGEKIATKFPECRLPTPKSSALHLIPNVTAKVALYTNQSLRAGDHLSNRGFALAMQFDGNLVLYDNSNAIWSTGTFGKGHNCYATMQGDGNLVIQGAQGVVWSSNTVRGNDRYELILQEDRNVVIYKGAERKSIWDTKTYFHA